MPTASRETGEHIIKKSPRGECHRELKGDDISIEKEIQAAIIGRVARAAMAG
jgi:hypothetical protein